MAHMSDEHRHSDYIRSGMFDISIKIRLEDCKIKKNTGLYYFTKL